MQIAVGEMTFTALTAGPADGPPVLLLHGFPEGARCWERVLVMLADAGLRCVAPDQRGYSLGARPLGVAAYRLDLLVGDAVGMLDALGWARANVVGHDWGAMVGWALAAGHPDRVRSLTAVSVPHPAAFGEALRTDADQQRRSAYLRRFREPEPAAEGPLLADDGAGLRAMFAGSGMTADQVAPLLEGVLAPGALTAALNWYRAMVAADYAQVGPVDVPTTYVWGSDDVAVGRSAATAAADQVRADCLFVELAQTSHWVPEQAPDLLAAAVLERVRG